MLPRRELTKNYVYTIKNNFKNFSTLVGLELHNLLIYSLGHYN